MAFRLEDFKKTTRKAQKGSGAPTAAYPHMMRDKKARERLENAIQTFDALVGKRRGEMDARTMMDFFDDPRVARGVVACLTRYYRYRTPNFAEVAGEEAERRLSGVGLMHPADLRALTYTHVNAAHDGFLAEAERVTCFEEIGVPLGLSGQIWDALLHLDAEENQILTRPGVTPSAADLAALYNFHSLDTPLKRAKKIVLSGLHLTSPEAAAVRALARDLGARAAVTEGGAMVTLTPGEVSAWLPQRPGRLGRCLLYLIQAYGSRNLTGYVDAPLGTRTFRVELTIERLAALGMRLPRKGELAPAALPDGAELRRRRAVLTALHDDLTKVRAQMPGLGWRVVRSPEPVVSARGVLLPDVTLQQGPAAVHVVLGEVGGDWGAPVLALSVERRMPSAALLLARAEAALADATGPSSLPAAPCVPPAVQTLCDQAARLGLVRSADAKRALHLLDETPLMEWVRLADDPRVRYIPGIGLCSQDFVAAIHGLAHPA